MKTVYQTKDGQIFDLEHEAKLHEEELKKEQCRQKLIELCQNMVGAKLNVADNRAELMADHIIEHVREFGMAMAPFLK